MATCIARFDPQIFNCTATLFGRCAPYLFVRSRSPARKKRYERHVVDHFCNSACAVASRFGQFPRNRSIHPHSAGDRVSGLVDPAHQRTAISPLGDQPSKRQRTTTRWDACTTVLSHTTEG